MQWCLMQEELEMITNELQKNHVLEVINGQKHPLFPKPVNTLHAKSKQNIIDWTTDHLNTRYVKSLNN